MEAYAGVRPYKRLIDAGIQLGTPPPDAGVTNDVAVFDRLRTLFVDPPRANLDATCRDLARTFDRVVYVSCSPETLARDLADLAGTHRPARVAAFDQFPYTPHLEAGVCWSGAGRGGGVCGRARAKMLSPLLMLNPLFLLSFFLNSDCICFHIKLS